MTKRLSMSKARRNRVMRQNNHACRECKSKAGPFAIDHWIPLWLGGGEDDGNLAPLCVEPCHREKTKREAKARAKIKRIRGETGKNKRKAKIPSRPFQKGQRKIQSRGL